MTSDDLAKLFFELTNRARTSSGVPALSRNDRLAAAAQDYAAVMRKADRLGHSVGGRTIKQRLARVGYRWRGYGENVASNMRPDPELAIRQFMNSRPHRANMLSARHAELGTGVAGPSRGGHFYYCQIFARAAAACVTSAELVASASSIAA